MPTTVKLWRVQDAALLSQVESGRLDREEWLRDYILQDPSILSPDFMVIGEEVETAFGGFIDLLGLNRDGDVVIVELKKGRTPRDVVAQALDYASWVKDLRYQDIVEIANAYLGQGGPIEDAFARQFGTDLPDVLNESHSILVVGAEIDASTERIITYLSDHGNINVNAVTFQYFRVEGGAGLLSRVFLLDPGQVRAAAPSGRRPARTREQLLQEAAQRGVDKMYTMLVAGAEPHFDAVDTDVSGIAFSGRVDRSKKAIFRLVPTKSDTNRGLKFRVYVKRFCAYFKIGEDRLAGLLPADRTVRKSANDPEDEWRGYEGFFRDQHEAQRFLDGLREVHREGTSGQSGP